MPFIYKESPRFWEKKKLAGGEIPHKHKLNICPGQKGRGFVVL